MDKEFRLKKYRYGEVAFLAFDDADIRLLQAGRKTQFVSTVRDQPPAGAVFKGITYSAQNQSENGPYSAYIPLGIWFIYNDKGVLKINCPYSPGRFVVVREAMGFLEDGTPFFRADYPADTMHNLKHKAFVYKPGQRYRYLLRVNGVSAVRFKDATLHQVFQQGYSSFEEYQLALSRFNSEDRTIEYVRNSWAWVVDFSPFEVSPPFSSTEIPPLSEFHLFTSRFDVTPLPIKPVFQAVLDRLPVPSFDNPVTFRLSPVRLEDVPSFLYADVSHNPPERPAAGDRYLIIPDRPLQYKNFSEAGSKTNSILSAELFPLQQPQQGQAFNAWVCSVDYPYPPHIPYSVRLRAV